MVTRLANVTHVGFTEVNAKINALVDAQISTEEKFTRLETNLTHMEVNLTRTEANVARTENNLNNLISTVDRYLRSRN